MGGSSSNGNPFGGGTIGSIMDPLGVFNKSQQTQASVPTAMQPLFNQAQGMINNSTGMTLNPATYTMTPLQSLIQGQAGSALGAGGMVPSMQNYISSVLNPNFANPMSNPNMSAALSAAQNQFTQGLGKNIDMLGSTFGMSGQTPQQSGAFGQQATNLSRQALGDYGNNISQMLMGQYNTSIGQQMQALSQGGQVSNVLNSMSGIASLPQQLATQQQQGQIDLNQIPFNMILGLLGQTPIGYPSYSPSGLSQILGSGGLGGLLGGVGAVAAA